jgi:hypothetical protein
VIAVPARSHWYAKLVGLPVQLPFVVLSVCPTCGVPETIGGAAKAFSEVQTAADAGPQIPTHERIAARRRNILIIIGLVTFADARRLLVGRGWLVSEPPLTPPSRGKDRAGHGGWEPDGWPISHPA